MSGARWRVLLIAALLIVAVGAISVTRSQRSRPGGAEPPEARPTLLLLTSLPLLFGEQFSLEGHGSDVLIALEREYRVLPISVTDRAELRRGRLLLMAHPPAQTADDLVALDQWVRAGGRLLLLADPMLEWPSERPLGDLLRPPPMFADTGLLDHWGLRLDAPAERGPASRLMSGGDILTASPGTLHGSCPISRDRLVARCRIGKGEVTVVADADFIGVQHLDGPIDHNLPALLEELGRLAPE